nr:hypothetical protein CR513_61608 [Ipomoea batatas]GME14639.1 hypothetical protein CR513_61608 [Ipomoea batatas]
MCAISVTMPEFESRYTSLRECSVRRKSKTLLGSVGSQREVEALRTRPEGLPGSSTLFLIMILTSSDPVPDNTVHSWAVEELTPEQKLITILSASFNMLFLLCGDAIARLSVGEMFVAIVQAIRSHCRSKVATQRLAPNAMQESTRGL